MRELRAELDAVDSAILELQHEEDREAHPCECVRLNADIEIYDMGEQERRKRKPVGAWHSFVRDALTAREDCPKCKGTGKPSS